MPESFRALIVRSSGPSASSLLHLVREGTSESMCSAFPIEKLKTARGFDEHLCPNCVQALQLFWRGQQRGTPR